MLIEKDLQTGKWPGNTWNYINLPEAMTDLVVITSVYRNDKLKFVQESIESILNQTFSEFHLFLILDGPVNEEVENYIAGIESSRLKLYRFDTNKGLATALNHLLHIVLENPEYKYIARMDADDISLPERFEKQHDFLIRNPEVSCVGSWYIEIDENGRHLSSRILPTGSEELRKYYFKRAPFAHPSVMYHRNLIESAGFYPTDTYLMEDNVLWGRALKAGMKFSNIDEFLFKFRIDGNFFKRRSGLKYGSNFIITRFRSNKSLNAPIIIYFYTLFSGLVRMLPACILKYLYSKIRSFKI